MSGQPYQPYYEVRPSDNGRWVVCHQLPGLAHGLAVDVDCLTRGAAERECAWLEAERERDHRRARQERAFL